MATASLIHFGVDTCFRLPVLRSAGFQIAECQLLDDLSMALASDPDAVLLEEDPRTMMEEAIALTRSQSAVPLILFASDNGRAAPSVDLVIRPLTTPDMWLQEIAFLIERSHQVRAEAREVRRRSRALVRDVTATRVAVREVREKSAQEQRKLARLLLEMRKRSPE